jgi:hypothetical protein
MSAPCWRRKGHDRCIRTVVAAISRGAVPDRHPHLFRHPGVDEKRHLRRSGLGADRRARHDRGLHARSSDAGERSPSLFARLHTSCRIPPCVHAHLVEAYFAGGADRRHLRGRRGGGDPAHRPCAARRGTPQADSHRQYPHRRRERARCHRPALSRDRRAALDLLAAAGARRIVALRVRVLRQLRRGRDQLGGACRGAPGVFLPDHAGSGRCPVRRRLAAAARDRHGSPAPSPVRPDWPHPMPAICPPAPPWSARSERCWRWRA